MTVRVEGVDGSPFEGVKVYAFDGATYKGYSGTSGKDGQVTFTLPQGNYRFRGDLNGTQFWSGVENHCTMPGCSSASIVLPGGNTSRSAVTINYSYDGLSRLTAADYSNGDYYHYAYDSVGNLLTETTTKGETAYTYDPANRLTSVNGQAVQWDDNGNMLADGQAMYKYNTANKLVGVTKGASSIVYAYSGLGDRLKQIADGVTTDYTLDINTGLTQVLQDGKQTYLYGNSRIFQIAETQTGYFLPDALGSMRQMTDSSADLTLAKSYDPYGNVVSSSGAGETVYGYTGEMQSGGLVHLRSRDYASQLGRFTSRDTWEGDYQRPSSLNQWVYVENRPINFTDPTGNYYEPQCSLKEYSITPYCIMLHFYGGIPDYEGINYVQYYRSSFDDMGEYIESKSLDKTIIAAAIAVQSEWRDYPPDFLKNSAYELKRNGCGFPFDLANKFLGTSGVGYAKVYPYDKSGKEIYGDLNLMSESIKAMTDRIYQSTQNCPDCQMKDILIISGMAQNAGFVFESYQYTIYHVNGKIQWEELLHDESGDVPFPNTTPTNILNNKRARGHNYNTLFQVQLFTRDLLELNNNGWDLPSGIDRSQVEDILSFSITGKE